MSDNEVLRVSGEGEERLKTVLSLFNQSRAKGFFADDSVFVLFWTDSEKATPLPSPMPTEQLTPMIMAWLEGRAHYGPAPDHDGDNERGWLCYHDSWGHIDGFGWQAFAAIRPMWAMYGK